VRKQEDGMHTRALLVVAASLFGAVAIGTGCGTVQPGGTGGSGGSGGAGGAGGDTCPAQPGDAPCGGDIEENAGLRCEYDTMPCPTVLICSKSFTHGGWLVLPPEKNSACASAGQVCTYVDENFDSGQKTTWTATCSPEKTWTVDEMTGSGGP
jgi:hypothetical protein